MQPFPITAGHGPHSLWGQLLRAARARLLSQRGGIIAALQHQAQTSDHTLCFQPVVDAHTFAVDKLDVKLLARQPHTVASGCWALQACLRQAAQWRAEGHAVPVLCFAASAAQLISVQYRSTLIDEAKGQGIALQRVELELADEVAADNGTFPVLDALRELRQRGVRLAFGEIGQRLSSLSMLRRMDFSSLKVGRETFGDIDCGQGRLAMVEAAVFLAHSHGMRVVASDVDTEARREFLVEAGCDYLQGHLFGTPAPA